MKRSKGFYPFNLFASYPFCLLTSLPFLLLSFLYAVPPPSGFVTPVEKSCKVNLSTMRSRVAAMKAAPYFPVPLSPTTSYVVVIRVDFNDKAMIKTKSESEAFFEDLKKFYLENSFGILTVSATVTNSVYRLPQTLATYGQGICSIYSDLAQDAVDAVGADMNFANGAGGGNPFNHIMIYHAGIGAETANDPGCNTDNIWSVFAPTVPATAPKTDGVREPLAKNGVFFNGVTVVPESEAQNINPLGVICHEYGHQLGLPDLYKTAAQSTVGKWSLMDGGVYLGNPQGSNPAHFDAWSKQFLGFSSPQTIAFAQGVSTAIGSAETTRGGFIKIPIDVSSVGGDKEYFLLEYRRKSGTSYDLSIPAEGLLIWHVDDSIASNESRLINNNINNGAPNRGVDLVEADSSDSSNGGDSGDPWPGSTQSRSFATPKSDAYNSVQSGIVVSAISGEGTASMTMNVTKLGARSTLEIAKAVNYPNPAGTSYSKGVRAAADTITTMVFYLNRPLKTAQLTIHDISGKLVKNVSQGELLLQAGPGKPSTDFKWVYEYNWNGKNDDAEGVASGIYLYRLKIDDSLIKTGKMVIIK